MIQPVTAETEWLRILSKQPVWNPPAVSMLIIAPHPDDETLGAGGLIAAQRAKGLEILVAAVTDGERGYPDVPDLAELRREEQTRALERLHVPKEKIVRFGLPDSNVASREQELIERLTPMISASTHVVAPWKGDFHPDHRACGRAAEEVTQRTGATLTSYFFWTWHYGVPADLQGLSLGILPLDRGLRLAKIEALLHHQTQLAQLAREPVLPELLLEPARRPFEVFSIA